MSTAQAARPSSKTGDIGRAHDNDLRSGDVPTSLTSQIANLSIGACTSRAMAVDPEITMAEFADKVVELKAAFRNNIAPSVRGAKFRSGGDYTIEIGVMVTTPGQVYLVAIVRRVA